MTPDQSYAPSSGETDMEEPLMAAPVYDWRRPHRVSKERLRSLEAMYERLVKGFEGWLVSRVRGQVDIRLQSVEQFSFREFTLSLPMPCASYLFDIDGTGQSAIVDIGPEFSNFMVDRLFGGTGSGTPLTRALTPIERIAVQGVAERISGLLTEIWGDHVPMALEYSGFESSPEILRAVNREEEVLVANLEFTFNAVSSLILISLPFSVLDKFFTSSGHQRIAAIHANATEREAARKRSESTVRATQVPMSARLPDFQISMRDLAKLEVGSVIPTGIPKDAKVIVRAASQERFIGHAGRVNGNLAIRVLDFAPSVSMNPDTETFE